MTTPITQTIGETVDAKTSQYTALYDRLAQDPQFRDSASALATHDLAIQRYVADEALQRLEAYITAKEATA